MAKEIGNKATSASKAAFETGLRRGKAVLIKAEEAALSDPKFPFRGSNTIVSALGNWIVGQRIDNHVNPDGTKMSLKQEIELRERTGYGTPEKLKKLKAQLNGEAQGPTMSDEDILKALNEPQPAQKSA